MAINKAEWDEIERKIESVDQAGIGKKQEVFEVDMVRKFQIFEAALNKRIEDKINKIDQEAKNREEFLKTDRFSYTLDRVLSVLEKHKCSDVCLTEVLRYTTAYCEKQEEKESYTDWRKIREQGLNERCSIKQDKDNRWDKDIKWNKD